MEGSLELNPSKINLLQGLGVKMAMFYGRWLKPLIWFLSPFCYVYILLEEIVTKLKKWQKQS